VLLSGGLDSSVITALSALQLREPVRSFSVDFVDQAENFTPNELRPTMDTPYVHDVVQHVGADHSEIVLDYNALADPEIRRRLVTARDLPVGFGDMDASLYLLFKAIRAQSTVALSGESADEVFGGYRQFHDPKVQQADAFPWVAIENSMFDTAGRLFTLALRSALDLDTFMQDRYSEAVAEVARVDGEDAFTHRMRVMCYLHLTRFVRLLLDRKDRMSMAVGLEVRVPFCDHRLVEYVYNTPWSLKTYDGREKSLLRGAARDVLPDSVTQRVKSPYPSTQDPHYVGAIQQQAKDLLGSADEVLFTLVDRAALEQMTRLDPATLPPLARNGIERALDLATWLDVYRPEVVI
jgi:asparagine synthase (glutamine-hydrolysing)